MAAARTPARSAQGTGGNGRPARPDQPEPRRPSSARTSRRVFAPFDRLGKPGDPSYVAGTGGDGQTQQGNQHGPGLEQRRADARTSRSTPTSSDYAQTSLDRGYVPLSVKDYVRDYFSSLDPSK